MFEHREFWAGYYLVAAWPRQPDGDLADDRSRSIGQHQHSIGQEHGLVRIVSDEQNTESEFTAEGQEPFVQVALGQSVHATKGFIEQQYLPIAQDGTKEADPLPHAARQRVRVVMFEPTEAEALHQGASAKEGVTTRVTAYFLAQGDIVERGSPRQQLINLHNVAKMPRLTGDVSIAESDAALRGNKDSGQDAQQR